MSEPATISAPDDQMRRRVSAYPGTLTFHDLIRRNKRQSVVLMIVMVVLGVAVGGVIASAIAVRMGAAPDLESLVPSIVLGCVVAFLAATLGTLWSWFGGANAILRMSGAREITKPLDPELFNVVEEVAIAAGLPMPRVFLIDDSAMNAFATGRDPKHAAVAITVGLRQKLTRDELQGVMAHEMAHVRHYDIRFSMLMATMVGLIAFACDAFWRILFYSRSGRGKGGKEGGGVIVVLYIAAIVLAILAPIIARIIQMAYSRQREYLADAGAVELTRNPLGLASALQKLANDHEPLVDTANRGTAHMYIVNPLRKMRDAHQALNSVFLSHPPIKERVARLLALAR
ncbi:MAG: M48 family metallopeptidase [Phycisphaerales bacterium]